MTSQKILDMRGRAKIFNRVSLPTRTRVFKALERETIQMQDQDLHLLPMQDGILRLGMQSQTILHRLMHIKVDKINWHQVLLSRLIILNMHHSIKRWLMWTIIQLPKLKIKNLPLHLNQEQSILKNLKSKANLHQLLTTMVILQIKAARNGLHKTLMPKRKQ